MLARFSNEVLSRGAQAVLPQKLSSFWLKRLQKLSDDFLDNNFTVGECAEGRELGDPILTACVHEVVRSLKGPRVELSTDQMAENITIYALSITMETIRRESGIEMTLPTTANLLSVDRIVQFGKVNPAFGRFLESVCIVREPETAENGDEPDQSWFKRLKKKILSRMAALNESMWIG